MNGTTAASVLPTGGNLTPQAGNGSLNGSGGFGMPPPGSHTMKVFQDVMLTSMLVVIMLAMGATIKLSSLKKRMKRPWGIMIGLISQVILLPLITFAFAHILEVGPNTALGMLVLGSAPGGTMSNIFTYWVNGDVTLSICLTSVATLVAIGTMPLNLLIYSRAWFHGDPGIPYKAIVTTLSTILIPVAAGIFIRWKWPRAAPVVTRVGTISGALTISSAIVAQCIMFPNLFNNMDWRLWVIGIFYPFIGFTFGFLLSKVMCLSHRKAKAVAFETGSQNVSLCLTIVSLTFPFERQAEVVLVPVVYGVFIMVDSAFIIVAYRVLAYVMWKHQRVSSDVTPSEAKTLRCCGGSEEERGCRPCLAAVKQWCLKQPEESDAEEDNDGPATYCRARRAGARQRSLRLQEEDGESPEHGRKSSSRARRVLDDARRMPLLVDCCDTCHTESRDSVQTPSQSPSHPAGGAQAAAVVASETSL